MLEPLLAGIDFALEENAVEPALQNGRRNMPAHRVLQKEQVRLVEMFDLRGDRGRNGSLCSACTSNRV